MKLDTYPQTGQLFQINVSDGGVPKRPVATATVTFLGLAQDRQIHTHVHGGPERALCLYSLERLLSLQAEGHPIFAGALGENLTLAGLDWDRLMPGSRLQIGEQVQLEITRYTSPCDALIPYFREGDFNRISHKLHPGWARVYARVLTPGELQVGAAITWLEPQATASEV